MIQFLLSSQNLPFTVSLAVMLAMALLEGITTLFGMGLSAFIEGMLPEVDLDLDMDMDAPDGTSTGVISKVLGWLRFGEVPVIILFVIFLTAFGLIGLVVQSLARDVLGGLMPASLAVLPALIISLPLVRVFGGALGKLMPRDETEAVSEKSFIGRVAVITLGNAAPGKPAEAKLKDRHGQVHYLMVEPDMPEAVLEQGSDVVLVKQSGSVFKAIPNTSGALVDE